jgi:hypothetical protein
MTPSNMVRLKSIALFTEAGIGANLGLEAGIGANLGLLQRKDTLMF